MKRNYYRLAFSDAANAQILEAYGQGETTGLRPSQFVRCLVNLGLQEYQFMRRERAMAASCDSPKRQTASGSQGQGWSGYWRGVKREGNVLFPEWN